VNANSMLSAANSSMDSEFSSITTQTKSIQQINEENRRAAAGLPPLSGSSGAATPAESTAPVPNPTPSTSKAAAFPARPAAPPAAPHMIAQPVRHADDAPCTLGLAMMSIFSYITNLYMSVASAYICIQDFLIWREVAPLALRKTAVEAAKVPTMIAGITSLAGWRNALALAEEVPPAAHEPGSP
ncbi:MAG: hypothetical protein SGPRY_010670, partial [Prymnesium sp.]